MVELEAQAQQQSALQHAGGHARVADRTEQDGVLTADLLEHRVRQGLPRRVPAARAEVVLDRVERDVVLVGDGAQDGQGLRGDFGSDAVARDDGEAVAAGHGRHPRSAGLRI